MSRPLGDRQQWTREIHAAMREARGDSAGAAARLGLDRSAFYARAKRCGISLTALRRQVKHDATVAEWPSVCGVLAAAAATLAAMCAANVRLQDALDAERRITASLIVELEARAA